VCAASVVLGVSVSHTQSRIDDLDNTAASLNTRGWEDSPFLSGDGTRLYFMYTPWQVWPIFFGRSPYLAGPERLGHHVNGDRNPWEDSDIYVSERGADGRFAMPVNMGFNDAQADCCMMTWAPGQFVYQRTQAPNSALTDIYFVRRVNRQWLRESAGPAVNGAASSESNPHVTADGRLLFFTSNRAGGFGQHDLYVAARGADGSWGEVQNLGAAINTPDSEDQVWVSRDQQTIYFNREPGPHVLTSRRTASGWAPPTEVLFGGQRLDGAEVSITDDGQTLVFATVRPDLEDILLVQAQRLGDGRWSAVTPLARR
jgi:hypothetical protein